MRNIVFSAGIMLLLFYLALTILGMLAIRFVGYGTHHKLRTFRKGFLLFSCIQIISFFTLFIYPFTTATAVHYNVYFLYNSILVTDIFSRLPLALGGLLSLLSPRSARIRPLFSMAGSILSLGLLFVFIWGFTIGNRALLEKHVTIYDNELPESFDGFRITQISDMHLGNFRYSGMFNRAVEANNRFAPDIMLFTGDMVNNFASETDEWQDPFLDFQATSKYAILGNHDYGEYYRWPDPAQKEENFNLILQAFDTFGFTLLRNHAVSLVRNDDTIYLAGVENWGHPPFPQHADLEAALSGIPVNTFRILMSHDPAHWYSVIQHMNEFNLTLSGHSHGLQWGIKPAGIEFSLIYMSRKTWGGQYGEPGNVLYVNRGLGTIGLPLRIDMPPEITFITLKKR